MSTAKQPQHQPQLPPIRTSSLSAVAAATNGQNSDSSNRLPSPHSAYSMTAFNVFAHPSSSRSTSRSRAASPVLTTSDYSGLYSSNAGPASPIDYFSDNKMDYLDTPKRGRRSFPNSGISGNSMATSTAGKGKGRETSHHHRSYSTSSNPRSAVSDSVPHNYGGITSRPSSRSSHSQPNSRPSSRSQSRYRVQSPLLHTSHSSTPDSTTFRNHRNPLSSAIAVLHNTLQCMKAGLGIGTGEWTDSRSGKWRIPVRLKAYVPLLIWVVVSVAMAVVVGVWHEQVFQTLDSLSTYLKAQGFFGYFILYLCIFITTFPPLPLYSTFIFLSGYSFGLWHGFLISYSAALSGAIVVFLCSRRWLKDGMMDLLDRSPGLKKVLRAIERRPKLLFLIRLSPYPYNVMNVLLASSETLSFSCYTWCTALALPKLLVHVSVGTTIRSFAESSKDTSNTSGGDEEELELERQGQRMKAIAGSIGLALCIGLFIYLLIVARRAVDDLDDTDRLPSIDSEDDLRTSPQNTYRPLHDEYSEMREVPTSTSSWQPTRPSRSSLLLDRGDMPSLKKANSDETVHQRHVFQRQDTGISFTLGRGENVWMASGKMDKKEEEWNEGLSEVVVGLEKLADARTKR